MPKLDRINAVGYTDNRYGIPCARREYVVN